MALDKSGDPRHTQRKGFTYAEAQDMIRKEGFMFEYLPEEYKTAEMSTLRDNWWRDSIVEKILYYRQNQDQFAEIVKQAQAKGLMKDLKAAIEKAEKNET